MEIKKENISNILNNISSLIPTILPISISFLAAKKGLQIINDIFYEEKLKDINKKDLLDYLIKNKKFINTLTHNEIKRFYIYSKKLYKEKNKLKRKYFFKNFFKKIRLYLTRRIKCNILQF